MTEKPAARRRASSLDDESKAMLYEGCNLSELGILFRMDHRVLVEKLHGIPADGVRNGTEIWLVSTAAPHLVAVPEHEIDKRIKRMHHNDLPKMLTKEYWAGRKARQDVEERDGDLWPTARVVKVLGVVMKLMKMNIRLLADTVDRQSELSHAQRATIKRLGDGWLRELHRAVTEEFKQAPSNEEHKAAMQAELEDDDEL
jgi:hypothetical protein